jgi:hypothetical protein
MRTPPLMTCSNTSTIEGSRWMFSSTERITFNLRNIGAARLMMSRRRLPGSASVMVAHVHGHPPIRTDAASTDPLLSTVSVAEMAVPDSRCLQFPPVNFVDWLVTMVVPFTVRMRSGQPPERPRTVPLIVMMGGTGAGGGVGVGDGVGAGEGAGAAPGPASWTTVYGCPPTTAWPTRCGPSLAAIRKPMTAVELPLGFATTSHSLSLDVDHPHPVNVWRVTVKAPPL